MITKEILELRRSGIGGSDVAAILGLSAYKTPLDVWFEKTGQAEEIAENEAIHWGNKLEPVIASEYSERHGVKLREPKKMYRHKEYPFLLANPDRLIVGKKAVLECKTTGMYNLSKWGTEGSDDIPTEYLLQTAHYRYVMNLEYVDTAVLIGGNQYKEYRYVKNEELEKKIINKLKTFWEENVEKRIAPEPKNRKDVEKLFKSTDRSVEADEELETDIKEISELKKQTSELEEKVKEKQEKVCLKLKDASVVVNKLGEKLCTYKSVLSNRFNTMLFKKEKPELYHVYAKANECRVLRIGV